LNHFLDIKIKLEQFIKRYYLSALLKGLILFFGFGLLYLLFWVSMEYFFWISTVGRTIIFWSLVLFELLLFYRLLCIPIFKYLKISSGIDETSAAKIVGDFFPEINDKLLNIVQLNKQPASELIVASIQQKTKAFKGVSFKEAVQFRDNLRYIKYAVLPLIIIGIVYISGAQSNLKKSLNRVVDYKTTYSPPAPFQFIIANEDLKTIENQPFVLIVNIEGSMTPEQVKINYNNQIYFLKKIKSHQFQYSFNNPTKDIQFQILSDEVVSNTFELTVLSAPKILDSNLLLDFPPHTKFKDKIISNFGNISIPEGTKLTWSFLTKSTDSVTFFDQNTVENFKKKDETFTHTKQVFSNLIYTIQTNNDQLNNYETLSYEAEVVRDRPPLINVQQRIGNSIEEELYFYGQITDDYGISLLQLQYYPVGKENLATIKLIDLNNRFDFTYQFPAGLNLLPDTSYELFFEVYDNDPFPAPNKTRSQVFTYLSKSDRVLKQQQLQDQQELLKDLEDSFSKNEEHQEIVDEFTKEQLQKESLNFNDLEKLQDIIKQQKNQDEMIKRFNDQMKKTLDQFSKQTQDNFKKNLSERLEEQNKRLEQDEKTLKELEDLAKKMKQDDLLEQLQKLSQQSKNKQKSLEQMLELTKRYYISQKADQLKNVLEELSEEQHKQAEKKLENSSEYQKKLNQKFDKVSKELEMLRKQNSTLSKPLSIPETKQEENSIQSDQKEAKESLEQSEQTASPEKSTTTLQKATKAQKKAAKKIKHLAQQIAQDMSGGSSQQLSEDVEMLRQILDNLLVFSFEQEALMLQPISVKATKKQKNIRSHFEHIDDSLFVVSLRQPTLSDKINNEIELVYFNIDKALGFLSESRAYEAKSAQQYAITSSNYLANLLSSILDNLEMQMQPSPGQGQGDIQLPDIIMSQDQLQKQANEMMKGQKQGSEKSNKNGEPKGSSESSGHETKEGYKPGESKRNNLGGSSQSKGQSNSEKYADPEETSEALFNLFQQQQELRQNLEKILQKRGLTGKKNSLLDSFEEVEQLIVNQGVTQKTLTKMKALRYELLKLDDALIKKGLSPQRQSNTNKEQFRPSKVLSKDEIKRLFGTEEILNRKPLPLRQRVKKKVQEYFNLQND
jgi:hypothetical protein